MAYLDARSGIARSGVTYAGWLPKTLLVKIAGTTRAIESPSVTIEEYFDIKTPNRLTFQTSGGYHLDNFQEIILGLGHIDNRLFGGYVLNNELSIIRGFESLSGLRYGGVALDYSWRLGIDDVVTATYQNAGVGTIVGDILARFTDGAFSPGEMPSSLGNVTITFEGESVLDAIARVANAVQGNAWVDYDKRVHVAPATGVSDGNPLSLGDATAIQDLRYSAAADQVRNRIVMAGGGNNIAQAFSTDITALFIDAANWDTYYSPSGGTVLMDGQLLTYGSVITGLGTADQPMVALGSVATITRDYAVGTKVRCVSVASDTARQAALATLIGGGSVGVVTVFESDERLSLTSTIARANERLTRYGDEAKKLSYSIVDDNYRVGKTITANLTTPKTIAGTFKIQSVVVIPDDDGVPQTGTASVVKWRRQIQASNYLVNLVDVLSKVK